MATNRKGNGHTVNITTASAAITSSKSVVQEGFFGIALGSCLSGESFELAIHGRWRIAVPASTVKGDLLYLPTMAESVDVSGDLTRTVGSNIPVVKAMETRDALGYADVLILEPRYNNP